jgi:hypothetical protein
MGISQISRCVYCGNTNFGNGCRYAPNGVHLHPDDPKRCSYCGSLNYGKGCRYSSDGVHIHGIKYNSMQKEGIESMIQNNIFLYLLNKPIVEFDAYKLGIVDEHGNCIKSQLSLEEQKSYTPDIRTIILLKKNLGLKLDVINSTLQLESTIKKNNIDEIKLAYYQEQINGVFSDLCEVVDQALQDNIPCSLLYSCVKQ